MCLRVYEFTDGSSVLYVSFPERQFQKEMLTVFVDTFNGLPTTIELTVPVFINKFLEGTTMDAETFFARWKKLSLPTQEAREQFSARFPMDASATAEKVRAS